MGSLGFVWVHLETGYRVFDSNSNEPGREGIFTCLPCPESLSRLITLIGCAWLCMAGKAGNGRIWLVMAKTDGNGWILLKWLEMA